MTYTFDSPQVVGNLGQQVTLKAMVIAAVAWNLQATVITPAVFSVTLLDAGGSGYTVNLVYSGSAATDFWKQISTQNLSSCDLETVILNKLAADGKIPPGTIA